MANRKKIAADARKEQAKNECKVRLINNSTSPRKCRYMADLVRGKDVGYALNVLKYSKKESSIKIRKLLLSAVASWTNKNESGDVDTLYIKEIFVDGGTIMRRLRYAPQGRGYRVRKRSNHITLVLESRLANVNQTIEVDGTEN